MSPTPIVPKAAKDPSDGRQINNLEIEPLLLDPVRLNWPEPIEPNETYSVEVRETGSSVVFNCPFCEATDFVKLLSDFDNEGWIALKSDYPDDPDDTLYCSECAADFRIVRLETATIKLELLGFADDDDDTFDDDHSTFDDERDPISS
jgi:hypothetical protein